jgi:hypothetical protein
MDLDCIIKFQIREALRILLKAIREGIGQDLSKRKNVELCLNAYNSWQELECDGKNYIFNIDNADDLKYLVDNDMITASGISWVLEHESHFFIFEGEINAEVKILSLDKVIEILLANATDYMTCAIMYVGRTGVDSPYANIYEEYVTSIIEDYK